MCSTAAAGDVAREEAITQDALISPAVVHGTRVADQRANLLNVQ